jgi:ferredoxin-NADP reductase
MLHALVAGASTRPVWWLHGARSRQAHRFAAESRALVQALPHGRSYVLYSRPDAGAQVGRDFDGVGYLSLHTLEQLGVPRDADFYLCGPARFMTDLTAALGAWPVAADRIHSERFAGSAAMTPGVVGAARPAPHLPAGDAGPGPLVSFARSGIAAHWRPSAWQSLLELAEACDVPVRWSCRTGVCHSCESGLVSGSVAYGPEPLDAPAEGNLLLCCSRPQGDLVIDI